MLWTGMLSILVLVVRGACIDEGLDDLSWEDNAQYQHDPDEEGKELRV